eukprot:bmy_14087T0
MGQGPGRGRTPKGQPRGKLGLGGGVGRRGRAQRMRLKHTAAILERRRCLGIGAVWASALSGHLSCGWRYGWSSACCSLPPRPALATLAPRTLCRLSLHPVLGRPALRIHAMTFDAARRDDLNFSHSQ